MTERKVKRVPATMFDDPFEVELVKLDLTYGEEYEVHLDGVRIGFITPHHAQSERSVPGSRLVSRGATFKAWAQRGTEATDSFDYYHQHRSQAAAIRRLVDQYHHDQRSKGS